MFHYLHTKQKDTTNKLVVSPRARLIHDSKYGFLHEAVYDQHPLSILTFKCVVLGMQIYCSQK